MSSSDNGLLLRSLAGFCFPGRFLPGRLFSESNSEVSDCGAKVFFFANFLNGLFAKLRFLAGSSLRELLRGATSVRLESALVSALDACCIRNFSDGRIGSFETVSFVLRKRSKLLIERT